MKKGQLKKGPLKKDNTKKVALLKKEDNKRSYFNLVGLAIIILLGIIIYSNSFKCSFHFDDFGNIVNNPSIRNLSDVKAWWSFYATRPIAVFTFALNYHFCQLDVRYWHLVNLIIHLANACLSWWLTLLIFSSPALKDHKIAKHKKILALLTALMFVSHPLATQSVTYIVQRMASMTAMFYLLSISLYMKARLSGKGNASKFLLFGGSFLSAGLAVITKENSYTLPFAILLLEIFFIRTRKLSINLKDYRVILLIATLIGIITIVALKFSGSIFKPMHPMLGHTYTVTAVNYLLTQFSVIVKYIQLLLLPINQMVDYDFPISNSFFEIRTLICFLVLLALIICAIFLFNRNRIISFGIFWFFMTLSIESSFIPLNDLIFEHRTYLPSFGFFLVLSSSVYILFREKNKFIALIICAIIIGSNSYFTYQRNKVWKDEFTLWNDNVEKAPNLARPITNRGFTYRNHGQWDKALSDYSRALEINPDYPTALSDRGVVYAHFGQWNKAFADYSRAIEVKPDNPIALSGRGIACAHFGQWDKALADYSKAIMINPNFIDAYSNRGIAFCNLKDWDKAIADFSKAIEINPNLADAYYNRGLALGNINEWNKAISDYSKAIGINPQYANAYYYRGVAYGKLFQWDKAIADYSRAIEMDPNFVDAYSNRDIAYKNLNSMKKQ